MNEITAEAAVDINAPRSEVWRSLTDPERVKEAPAATAAS